MRLSKSDVLDWLQERRANCVRIAAEKKSDDDKAGWLEDAIYFHAATKYLEKKSGHPAEGTAERVPGAAQLIGKRATLEITSFSAAGLYRAIRNDGFPKPYPIGPRRVAWNRRQVEAWIQARMDAHGLQKVAQKWHNDVLPEDLPSA